MGNTNKYAIIINAITKFVDKRVMGTNSTTNVRTNIWVT